MAGEGVPGAGSGKWGEEFPSFGDKSSAVWEEFQVRLKYLALKTVMVTCIGP